MMRWSFVTGKNVVLVEWWDRELMLWRQTSSGIRFFRFKYWFHPLKNAITLAKLFNPSVLIKWGQYNNNYIIGCKDRVKTLSRSKCSVKLPIKAIYSFEKFDYERQKINRYISPFSGSNELWRKLKIYVTIIRDISS